MTAVDTNILLPALEPRYADHKAARAFLDSLQDREDVVMSEFVLVELYVLLRNPAVMNPPLAADEAVDICQSFRRHPKWLVYGFPPDSRAVHDALWDKIGERGIARRRAYDTRMAISLLQQGVKEIATVNTKDFEGLGFRRVWNPLHPAKR